MSPRPAPFTTAAYGSSRCPECTLRFVDTPGQVTVDLEQDEAYTRRGSVSGGETRRVTRRWHADCLTACEQRIADGRAAELDRREAELRELAEAAGLDPAPYVARLRGHLPAIGEPTSCFQVGHVGVHSATGDCLLTDGAGRCVHPQPVEAVEA